PSCPWSLLHGLRSSPWRTTGPVPSRRSSRCGRARWPRRTPARQTTPGSWARRELLPDLDVLDEDEPAVFPGGHRVVRPLVVDEVLLEFGDHQAEAGAFRFTRQDDVPLPEQEEREDRVHQALGGELAEPAAVAELQAAGDLAGRHEAVDPGADGE